MGKSAKKKRQREAMAAASALSPNGVESDVSTPQAASQSPTPIQKCSATSTPAQSINNNDDPSTWSKSKKKRMKRLKSKARLSIAAENGETKNGSDNGGTKSKQTTPGGATGGKKVVKSPSKPSASSGGNTNDNNGHSPSKKRQRKNSDVKEQPATESASKSKTSTTKEVVDNQGISPKKKKKENKPSTPALSQNTDDKHKSPSKSVGKNETNSPIKSSEPTVSDGSSPKKKNKKKKKKKSNAATQPPTSLEDAVKSTLKSSQKKDKGDSKNKTTTKDAKSNSKSDSISDTNNKTNNTSPKVKITLPKPSQMSTLQKAFLERLTSSRFRELNEELYTHSSNHSFEYFTKNPELFDQYHVGFRKQVKEWPVNPVDVIYKKIVNGWRKDRGLYQKGEKPKGKGEKNAAGKAEKVVVADFGCGDAKLAERLLALQVGSDGQTLTQAASKKKKSKSKDQQQSSCPFKVFSFDLVSGGNPLVTPADMSDVPLPDESVDVGVYSLALMGTNVADFVREAWRVLKFGGTLRVAEVRSRFETASAAVETKGHGGGKRLKSNNGKKHQQLKKRANAPGGDDNDTPQPLMLLDEFIALMERCGFQCTNMDRSNKMFLFMDFLKADGSSGLSDKERFTAKPCIYKRR